MASINVRKETRKLYIDFRYRNIRCREQTELNDTAQNRKRLRALLDKIEAEILLGTFNYKETFPNGSAIKKLDAVAQKVQGNSAIPTVTQFAKTWFQESKVQWRKSYLTTVTNIIENRVIPYFGDIPVNEVTKSQVLQFRGHLCNLKKRDGAAFSPGHVNRHLKIFRAIINEAAERFDFISPYKSIKPLKVPKTDIKPFTPEEIKVILDNCRPDFKEYFLIRFFTGMRTSEIDGLRWKYVDFEKRLIMIRETISAGEAAYTKNDFSQREIYMSDQVYNAFKVMKSRTGSGDYVFVTKAGQPLEYNSVTKHVWYPLLRLVGVEKRNPYQMRHTAATLWLASGESPEWIARQMGHANTEMLFRVYSRYVPNLTRNDGSAMNTLVEKLFVDDKKGDQDEDQ
ncbi:site-specific integrase [Psychrosphaera sp. F3M07]|uniref:site-specific integrase n=1 Tax=Psychrosphaera sp. F3M07 TaxID=2841560 RepID=UPI001C09B6D0|nr:site-specific integrase [Psychrosphaera sp. F3M07]MBU2919622.1 site-specific integrase [Psychrosphaera sp. F3M07]